MSHESGAKIARRQPVEAWPREKYNIDTAQGLLIQSKAFPDESFDPVSGHGRTNVLFRNRKAKAGESKIVWTRQQRHGSVTRLASLFENPLEFSGSQEAYLFWKTAPCTATLGVCKPSGLHLTGLTRGVPGGCAQGKLSDD